MKRNASMTDEERRYVAFHEAGHVAMIYWRGESLHSRHVSLHGGKFGGSTHVPMYDISEWDLMVLISGPLVEDLSFGILPTRAIRRSNSYRQPNSDSSRIRKLIKLLCGKDDKQYQFRVQERCREILQDPRTWKAIETIADRLAEAGEISGEDCTQIFEDCNAPTWLNSGWKVSVTSDSGFAPLLFTRTALDGLGTPA